jgi:hypothetical protein
VRHEVWIRAPHAEPQGMEGKWAAARDQVREIAQWVLTAAVLIGSAVVGGGLHVDTVRGAIEGAGLAAFVVATLAGPEFAEHARQRREMRESATTDHRW